MKKQTILGIDPGTRITGFGVIEHLNQSYNALNFGCIRTPKNSTPPQLYFYLYTALEELIERYHPDVIAVETQFVYKNPQTAMKLGMARGMALLISGKYDIPLFEYAPRKAKLAVVGNGGASKQQVQQMIKVLLNLSVLPEPEDAADALALALCHAHNANYQALVN